VAHGNHLYAFAHGIVLHVIKTNVATLTVVQDNSFDQNKCVRMALIHDIGEAIIGDIAPSDGISKGI
jgi:5'-deoxynucleotidase YfbR-like HD superfamily hydrolase